MRKFVILLTNDTAGVISDNYYFKEEYIFFSHEIRMDGKYFEDLVLIREDMRGFYEIEVDEPWPVGVAMVLAHGRVYSDPAEFPQE